MITIPAYFVQLYAKQLQDKHGHIPGVAARLDKAIEIAKSGDISEDAGQFFVLSSNNDGTGYHVGSACTCPDYEKSAPQIGSARFCKHLLAVAMLRRYIAEQISPRILEGLDDAPNRKKIKWQAKGKQTPICHLMRYGQGGDCLTDGQHFGIRIEWSSKLNCWRPRTDADYLQAAYWLEHVAQPVPIQQRREAMDAEAYDAEIMPYTMWQNLYGHLYRDLRPQ